MANTAATVAQQRAQATRDEQMRRTLIGLLDVQATEWRHNVKVWRISQSVALLAFVSLFSVFVIDMFTVVMAIIHSERVAPIAGNSSAAIEVFPFGFLMLFLSVSLLFPHRIYYLGVNALLHLAANGHERLAPRAVLQPIPRMLADSALENEHITPLMRWRRSMVSAAGIGISGSIIAGGIFTYFCAMASDWLTLSELAQSDSWWPFALFYSAVIVLMAAGATTFVIGLRSTLRTGRMWHDLTVSADADGLTWTDPAWRSRKQVQLAWRDARSFSVATYQREAGGNKWQVYILDGGQTRLLWALPFDPYAEQSAVHNRLAGLIVGTTGLPLRDLTPGLVALGAALNRANPLPQTKAEKMFATPQPAIPGFPTRALRRWTHGFYAVLTASLVVTLAYAALSLVAWIAH